MKILARKPIKRKTLAPKGFTKGLGGIKRAVIRSKLTYTGRKPKKQATSRKEWSLKKADTEFRKFMLDNFPIHCAFPNCTIINPKKLTVSHYFGRVKKGTRFEPENCCFLCRNHHYWDKQLGWEFQKQTREKHGYEGRYTMYMKQRLGEQGFYQLGLQSERKISPKKAIEEFRTSLLSV